MPIIPAFDPTTGASGGPSNGGGPTPPTPPTPAEYPQILVLSSGYSLTASIQLTLQIITGTLA